MRLSIFPLSTSGSNGASPTVGCVYIQQVTIGSVSGICRTRARREELYYIVIAGMDHQSPLQHERSLRTLETRLYPIRVYIWNNSACSCTQCTDECFFVVVRRLICWKICGELSVTPAWSSRISSISTTTMPTGASPGSSSSASSAATRF